MQPDGTNSLSTADENPVSPKGIHVTEPDTPTGSEIKKYPKVSVPTWSYLFLHNSKVKSVERQLQADNMPYFVHKTIRYYIQKDPRPCRPTSQSASSASTSAKTVAQAR